MTIAPGTSVSANGATLSLGDTSATWTNNGTINATNSTVNLNGTVTAAGLGTFNRTGGTVNLTGTLNNASNTFTLNNASGSWNLAGGTINGGTLNLTDGQTLKSPATTATG